MENLTKLETVAALASVRAVLDESPIGLLLAKNHPLKTAAEKLENNLKEFNDLATKN